MDWNFIWIVVEKYFSKAPSHDLLWVCFFHKPRKRIFKIQGILRKKLVMQLFDRSRELTYEPV